LNRLLYININFDLTLGAYQVGRYQQLVDELVLNFICAGDAHDCIIARNVPDEYLAYLETIGIPYAGIHIAGTPLKSVTPFPWGWNYEAVALFTRYGLECTYPDLAIVKKVNSRIFSTALAREMGCHVQGVICHTKDEVYRKCGDNTAYPLVIKPVYGNAGIGFIIKHKPVWSHEEKAKLHYLLQPTGAAVVIEPWVARKDDYSISFDLDRQGAMHNLTMHHNIVNRRGMFQGIMLDPLATCCSPWQDHMYKGAETVARALHAEDYWGPVGIDLYSFYDRKGNIVLQPLCEINARLTMAFIVRAMQQKLALSRPMLLAEMSRRVYTLPERYTSLTEELQSFGFAADEKFILCSPLRIRIGDVLQQPRRIFCIIVADTTQRIMEIRDFLAKSWRK
jgi:biotin carboxylase